MSKIQVLHVLCCNYATCTYHKHKLTLTGIASLLQYSMFMRAEKNKRNN